MKKASFVKGTIFGAIVGMIAGVLLAPKSGKETREDIKRKAQGTYQDITDQLSQLREDVSGRVDSLKAVAKDLHGEAKQESQELIRRAEVLMQDLRVSAGNLAKNGAQAKDATMKDVKLLLGEGSDVMKELERVTRTLAGSAKDKFADASKGGEEG